MPERDGDAPLAVCAAAAAAERRLWVRALVWKWVCLAIIALSFVLNPDRPTGGVGLCPVMRATGLPCPGCGITRSMVHLGHGHVVQSLRHHPLGPLVWTGMLLYASTLVWPIALRGRARRLLGRMHKPLTLTTYALIVLLTLFGAVRIVYHYLPPPPWWPW